MHKRAKIIEERIKEMNSETLLYYWRIGHLSKDRVSQWKLLLEKNTKSSISSERIKDKPQKISITDIFESGLNI